MGNLVEEVHDFLKEIYHSLEDKPPKSTNTPFQGTEEKQVVIDALWEVIGWAKKRAEFGELYVVSYWPLI